MEGVLVRKAISPTDIFRRCYAVGADRLGWITPVWLWLLPTRTGVQT